MNTHIEYVIIIKNILTNNIASSIVYVLGNQKHTSAQCEFQYHSPNGVFPFDAGCLHTIKSAIAEVCVVDHAIVHLHRGPLGDKLY